MCSRPFDLSVCPSMSLASPRLHSRRYPRGFTFYVAHPHSLHSCPTDRENVWWPQLSAAHSTADPGRISPTVEDCANPGDISFNAVINRERKALAQATVVSKNFSVNTSVGGQ